MVTFYLSIARINTAGGIQQRLRKYVDTTLVPGFDKLIDIGIDSSLQIIGIDIRPVNGLLYAVTSNTNLSSPDAEKGNLYIIDPNFSATEANSTLVGTLKDSEGSFITVANRNYGVDFNPVLDRLRVVSDSVNLSVNPNDAVTTIQTPISAAVNLIGAAYTNNFAGAETTILYDVGTNLTGQLFKQNPPAAGTLEFVGNLLIDTSSFTNGGFDIQTVGNINEAYGAFEGTASDEPFARLYSVNLTTGQAVNLGSLDLPEEFFITGFTLIQAVPAPCLHPATLVAVPVGKSKSIEELRAGDCVIDYKGRPVKIEKNLRFEASDSFILVKKGAFKDGDVPVPSQDLLIRKGHPILFNGKSIKPERLIKRLAPNKVNYIKLSNKEFVWSLCTEKRTFVMMQGVAVVTWVYSDLIKSKKYNFTEF
jgi:hypothetical protein